jgi:hypothetical protein
MGGVDLDERQCLPLLDPCPGGWHRAQSTIPATPSISNEIKTFTNPLSRTGALDP